MTAPSLMPVRLEQLRRFSTCLIASAIERFQVRLPNSGFSDSSIRCVFDDLPPIIGYAATARIRTADPPMEGGGYLIREGGLVEGHPYRAHASHRRDSGCRS